MSIVDGVIVIAAIGYAIGGFRTGAIVGAFSLVGFFAGAVLGAQLAQPLGSRLAGGRAQIPVAICCVLLVSLIGQLVAVWIGGRLRQRVTWRRAQALDSGIGGLLGVLSVLLVSWMVAVPLASSPYPSLSSAVRRSAIVRSVDAVMPGDVRTVYSSLRSYIDRSGFPPVLGDLQSTRIVDVTAPDAALSSASGVARAQASTFKIYGDAPSCNRGIEGSGFVFAPHKVLTNAHVVAGTTELRVVTGAGQLPATVVLFDPDRDVAVLDVPSLDAPVLPFAAATAQSGGDSIVVGYPQDGPFDVEPARIRARERITGHDIYGSGTVVREIYAIRSTVRSGNSGGPLISPAGEVFGMVFATALDAADTGFVLTDAEISADAAAGAASNAAVGTGACT